MTGYAPRCHMDVEAPCAGFNMAPGFGHWRVGCQDCGARTDTMTVIYVHAWPRDHVERARRTRPGAEPYTHSGRSDTRCVNAGACAARRLKREDRARLRRSRLFVLREPDAPDAPRGTCRWCGGPIYRCDGRPDRRRNYHYGERTRRWLAVAPPDGEPDCYLEWMRSRTTDARDALVLAAVWAGEAELTCADCGAACVEGLSRERPGWSDGGRAWAADHVVPLEDGGEHSLENLACRCDPCHAAKTARENRERARRRREEAAGQVALAI